MSQTPFKLLGLTQDHKDFLHRYAQNELGTSSRTKAILALIEKAMHAEKLASYQNQTNIDNKGEQDKLKKQAIQNKENYINQYHKNLKEHNKNIQEAKANKNHELAKSLSRKRIVIKKRRIQLSIPIYDYEYLEKLAKNSNSSIQYYIKVLVL